MSFNLDPSYVVTSDVDTFFVSRDTGLPLSGGTLEFWRDADHTTAKAVYEQTGTGSAPVYTSLGSIVTLSAVGTVQDSGGNNVLIYYKPFDADGDLDLYYVVCKDSNGVVQFTRQAWPNITSESSPLGNSDFQTTNQITNPQFNDVFFNTGGALTSTFTASGTDQVFALAPGWDLVLSGAGTVTVQRVAISGNDQVPTNPPYVIDLTVSAGVTKCWFRQRFGVNSGLWSSVTNGPIFLSASITAENQGVGTSGVQIIYIPSTGTGQTTILDFSFPGTTYTTHNETSAAAIPASNNTDVGNAGYIDIVVAFATGSHTRFSSIQIVPTTDPTGSTVIPFELNASSRNEAFMGSYYIPRLNAKQIPSYLVGWDFTNAPYQFGTSGTIANAAGYLTDQTIAFRGATGAVAWARSAVTGGLQLTTAGTNDAFYIMQYLNVDQVNDMIGGSLSVNVFGYKGSVGGNVTMKVYLVRAPSTGTIPILPTSIGTIATDGTFTVTAANWALYPRSGLDTATAILNTVTNNDEIASEINDYGFTGWKITDVAQLTDTARFAIVVTFAYIDASTVVTVNSISVCPGDIPARPAVQSADEVLSQCQYYYEKSTPVGILPTATGTASPYYSTQWTTTSGGSKFTVYPRSLDIQFNRQKRATPTMALYSSKTGTVGNVYLDVYNANLSVFDGDVATSGNWFAGFTNTVGCVFNPTDRSVNIHDAGSTFTNQNICESLVYFNFTADARLGVV